MQSYPDPWPHIKPIKLMVVERTYPPGPPLILLALLAFVAALVLTMAPLWADPSTPFDPATVIPGLNPVISVHVAAAAADPSPTPVDTAPVQDSIQGLNPSVTEMYQDAAVAEAQQAAIAAALLQHKLKQAKRYEWGYRATEIPDVGLSLVGIHHGAKEINLLLLPLIHCPPAYIVARFLMGELLVIGPARRQPIDKRITTLKASIGVQSIVDFNNAAVLKTLAK